MTVQTDERPRHQKINFAATLGKPIHAMWHGQPVRLLVVGDVEGMSPCYLYVNAAGESGWAVQDEFTIVDFDALPVQNNALGMTLKL